MDVAIGLLVLLLVCLHLLQCVGMCIHQRTENLRTQNNFVCVRTYVRLCIDNILSMVCAVNQFFFTVGHLWGEPEPVHYGVHVAYH